MTSGYTVYLIFHQQTTVTGVCSRAYALDILGYLPGHGLWTYPGVASGYIRVLIPGYDTTKTTRTGTPGAPDYITYC